MSAPLTDEDLAIAERDLMEGTGHERRNAGLRLLNEVRRLRSDEWLSAAALEIATDEWGARHAPAFVTVLMATLRKHRDAR